MCGAGWRNSVFNLEGIKLKEYEHESIMGETYVGCYVDNGKRDLPKLIRDGYGNYEKCFELAKANGMKFAGLQYSG